MGKEIVTKVQEAQSFIQDKPREEHTEKIINHTNKNQIQRKILKAMRKKQQITCKGNPSRLSANSSAETLQARREWQNMFKVIKQKNIQQRILYPPRLSFRFDGDIKNFTDKQKL